MRTEEVVLDIPDLAIFDAIFGGLTEEELDFVATIDGPTGQELTYRQLVQSIEAFAGALAARGIGVGDVVGLHAPNSAAFAIAFHGILRSGATATTINSLSRESEIKSQLDMAGAVAVFTVSMLAEAPFGAARALGMPDDRIFVLDGLEGHQSLSDLVAEGNPAPVIDIDPATHVAVIPFSSGTTGVPKGVMLTHRNLVSNVTQCLSRLPARRGETLLAVLPFFHIYGMTVLLNLALHARARLVTMPKFDLENFLALIQQHAVSFVFIAPPMAVALGKHPMVDQYDVSSLNTLFSGAAPLDGKLAELVEKRLGATVLQGYGMTELSPVSHAAPRIEGNTVPLASVGTAVSHTDDRLVDPQSGADIETPAEGLSERGELWVRGPQVMAGYLDNEEATRAMLTEDGWLKTGDIGVFDAERNLFIVDRLKELIKYKGYQVAPAELEAVLLTSERVADAAVIGEPREGGDETVVAFVVAKGEPDADAILEEVNGQVAPYKRVRRIEFVEAVPKSASGKILRKDLKAMLAERALS